MGRFLSTFGKFRCWYGFDLMFHVEHFVTNSHIAKIMTYNSHLHSSQGLFCMKVNPEGSRLFASLVHFVLSWFHLHRACGERGSTSSLVVIACGLCPAATAFGREEESFFSFTRNLRSELFSGAATRLESGLISIARKRVYENRSLPSINKAGMKSIWHFLV